jgi:hypothetical protein
MIDYWRAVKQVNPHAFGKNCPPYTGAQKHSYSEIAGESANRRQHPHNSLRYTGFGWTLWRFKTWSLACVQGREASRALKHIRAPVISAENRAVRLPQLTIDSP